MVLNRINYFLKIYFMFLRVVVIEEGYILKKNDVLVLFLWFILVKSLLY